MSSTTSSPSQVNRVPERGRLAAATTTSLLTRRARASRGLWRGRPPWWAAKALESRGRHPPPPDAASRAGPDDPDHSHPTDLPAARPARPGDPNLVDGPWPCRPTASRSPPTTCIATGVSEQSPRGESRRPPAYKVGAGVFRTVGSGTNQHVRARADRSRTRPNGLGRAMNAQSWWLAAWIGRRQGRPAWATTELSALFIPADQRPTISRASIASATTTFAC
jgi:hypothetical protein